MKGTLGAQTVVAEEVAVIRGENHEGILRQSEIVEAIDDVVGSIDEDAFIALLPHLRLALMPLDPGEVDRFSAMVAERLGIREDMLARVIAIHEAELLRNVALDRDMARKLQAEGVA